MSTKGYTIVICVICHRVLCIEAENFRKMFLGTGATNFHLHWDRREDHPNYVNTSAQELWKHIPISQ